MDTTPARTPCTPRVIINRMDTSDRHALPADLGRELRQAREQQRLGIRQLAR